MEQMFKGIATGVESAFKKVAADCRESHRYVRSQNTYLCTY